MRFLWLFVMLTYAQLFYAGEKNTLLHRDLIQSHITEHTKKFNLSEAERKAYKKTVYERIVNGGCSNYRLMVNNETAWLKELTQHQYLDTIIASMWHLYAESLAKNPTGSGFVEGAFHVYDPKNTFYNFLIGYKECLTEKQHTVRPEAFITNCQSSHLSRSKQLAQHTTIAMRYTDDQDCEGWLPYAHKALLFIFNRESSCLYIKFEHTYRGDTHRIAETKNLSPALSVAWSGMQSVISKCCYSPYLGILHNDDPSYSKEHIPQAVHTAFNKCIHICKNNPYHAKLFIDSHCNNIADMIHGLNQLQSEGNVPKNALDSIAELLRELHQRFDYTTLRHGNEIIIKDEFLTSYFYWLLKHNQEAAHEVFTLFNALADMRDAIYQKKLNPEKSIGEKQIREKMYTFGSYHKANTADKMPEKVAAYLTYIKQQCDNLNQSSNFGSDLKNTQLFEWHEEDTEEKKIAEKIQEESLNEQLHSPEKEESLIQVESHHDTQNHETEDQSNKKKKKKKPHNN